MPPLQLLRAACGSAGTAVSSLLRYCTMRVQCAVGHRWSRDSCRRSSGLSFVGNGCYVGLKSARPPHGSRCFLDQHLRQPRDVKSYEYGRRIQRARNREFGGCGLKVDGQSRKQTSQPCGATGQSSTADNLAHDPSTQPCRQRQRVAVSNDDTKTDNSKLLFSKHRTVAGVLPSLSCIKAAICHSLDIHARKRCTLVDLKYCTSMRLAKFQD